MAKRDLAPEIQDAVIRLQGFGARVQRGDIRITARWAQRILPPHDRVGAALLALARLMADSRRLISAENPPRQSPEPTLNAIRDAIDDAPQDDPTLARGLLWSAGTKAALSVMLAFALPAGAIRALVFHLDGGDLADWS